MDCYTIAQTRAQWYKLMRRVEGGETIGIARSGQTVALIERVEPERVERVK
ncbi:MAG: hypothetical protein JO013_15225 [Alphaproteobacteria bacterium]|nr:hypothetical protein [Alphaproteobacteria bacterium]